MAEPAFLVVGLGNPGTKYAGTRHNIGFEVVDALAVRWGVSFTSKFHGLVGETSREGRKVLLLKPQTYMNRSGLSVGEVTSFFKIPVDSGLLVVSDDIDLPPAAVRLRLSGGSGGHNGLKSVIESVGTEGFPRLRIGVGRSPTMAADAHVLVKIPPEERERFTAVVTMAADGVELILKEGLAKAMNTVNRKAQAMEGAEE